MQFCQSDYSNIFANLFAYTAPDVLLDPDDDTESDGRIVTIELPKKNGMEWWTVSWYQRRLFDNRMKCPTHASMSTPASK